MPQREFVHNLTDHLHAQWPGAVVTVRVTPTLKPVTVVLDDNNVDPVPYERRCQEYAGDVFTMMCE